MVPGSFDVHELLKRATEGDEEALRRLFEPHRPRLVRLIRLRMDQRLRGRVDASDVIQDTFLDVWKGLRAYADRPELPFYVWLRWIACRQLVHQQRRHLGAQARNVDRERVQDPMLEASSEILAEHLLGHVTSPSHGAMRAELRARMQELLESLPPLDREILALRHFEQLGNAETAAVLGIQESAASTRYVRALRRLRERMHPGRELPP